MYLKKVYRHSKLLFASMLFFIGMQALVTAKHGMVFTPWYNYGMYSSVIKPKPTYEVLLITVGNDTLRGHQFSPQHWDRLVYTPVRIDETRCSPHFFQQEVSRLFGKAKLPAPDAKHFIGKATTAALFDWYGPWLQQYFGWNQPPVIRQYTYGWDGKQLYATRQDDSIHFEQAACRSPKNTDTNSR